MSLLGLRSPAQPLLLLLDQLGQSRAEAHRHVVHSAVQELLSRIDALSPDRLLRLLEAALSVSEYTGGWVGGWVLGAGWAAGGGL